MGSSDANTAVKKLNAVYMRVARRIAGDMRYGQNSCATSLQVREKLCIPSIECKMRQLRLKYLSRLCAHGPSILKILLACRGGVNAGSQMPWTKQILDDLSVIKAALSPILGAMPPPAVDPALWVNLICGFPREWHEIVDRYIVYISIYDNVKCSIYMLM